MRILGAIPARWASTRLPGKPLALIAGRPMIGWVLDRAKQANELDEVLVLTDDQRIVDCVRGLGSRAEFTSEECRSGTDRIAEGISGRSDVDAVINIQGDEPLIDPSHIDRLAGALRHDPGLEMATLCAPADQHDLETPDVVKVVRDLEGRALYFSRSPLPYPRSATGAEPLKHIGIYGYRRRTLLRLAELKPTPLELSESLEQLRALENGIRIQVIRVGAAESGVDSAADLARAEAKILAREKVRPHEFPGGTS